MAQDVVRSRSRSSGRTYTEQQWELVKVPFTHYYIEKNLSLKESAKRMAEKHGFEATLRQWERRIAPEKWNLTKYTSREERLQTIEAAGKTLLEVSHRGRRRSTASDGRPSLNEDRNLRRFARREVSRESRQRAKSVSELSDLSDQEMSDTSAAPSPAPSDIYTLDVHDISDPFPYINHDGPSDMWMSNVPSSQGSTIELPQIIVDQIENGHGLAVPQINILAPDEPSHHIAPEHIAIARHSEVNAHYPQRHIDTNFHPFQDGPATQYNIVQNPTPDYNTHMSPHDRTTFPSDIPWYDAVITDPAPPAEIYPDVSYTQLMGLDAYVMDEQNVVLNAPMQNYETAETPNQEQMPTPLTPEGDTQGIDDPTHADVHALLQEHYARTMQMIDMCFNSCEHNSSTESLMTHLQLLKKGVQAQSTVHYT